LAGQQNKISDDKPLLTRHATWAPSASRVVATKAAKLPLFCHLHTICAYSLVWSASINTPRHQDEEAEDMLSSLELTPFQMVGRAA